MSKEKRRPSVDLLGTAAIAAATAGTAIAGGLAGDFESLWYQQLRKPDWQPSGQVIGAVWSVLYTLTAVAGTLLWRRRGRLNGSKLFWLFVLQFGLNAAFTAILTRFHSLRLAVVDCGMLVVGGCSARGTGLAGSTFGGSAACAVRSLDRFRHMPDLADPATQSGCLTLPCG